MRNMGADFADGQDAGADRPDGRILAGGCRGQDHWPGEGIINSMTRRSALPELIKASRKRRIATGAGCRFRRSIACSISSSRRRR